MAVNPAVMRERSEEQKRMQLQPPALGEQVIRSVRVFFDNDDDFVVHFENHSSKYALLVALENKSRLGWKECHALADCMKIAARGTDINDQSFLKLCEDLEARYKSTNGPLKENGRLSFLVNPGPGSIKERTEKGDFIAHMSVAFDEDADFVFEARTFAGQAYHICLALPTPNQFFFVHDCRAFIDVLFYFETGDCMNLTQCLCALALLRKKYNYVRLGKDPAGKLRVNLTATSVSNPDPIPPAMESARKKMHAIMQAHEMAQAGGNAPGLPPCPYRGIRYTRALQQSGQAQVYAGLDQNGLKVAVKVFSGEAHSAAETYRIELRMLLKMCEHPNVIEVLEFFETPQPALVTRLIEGVGDMAEYIRNHGRMEPVEVRRIAIELGEGIAHLHRSGIVHRDLKTANVLLKSSSSGRLTPVIIDLGLGKSLRKRSGSEKNSVEDLAATMQQASIYEQTGSIKGTVLWMAPEMITHKEWSEKTDVFAFGIILWELLSGKKPYDHLRVSSSIDMLMKIANGARPDIGAVRHAGKELVRVIEMCWQAEPKRRPRMQEVLDIMRGNDPVALFNKLDKNGSKCLDFGEFVQFLQRYAPTVPPGDMAGIFAAIDSDGSGGITLDEFLRFWRTVMNKGMRSAMTFTARSRRAG